MVAPLAGTIIATAYQAGGAGWYVAEHTVDGLDFFYAHCQAGSLAVSTGQAVGAARRSAMSARPATPPDHTCTSRSGSGGWQAQGAHPIDPLPYLEAWDHPAGA